MLIDRLVGALKLDANVYEEIEHDESATSQAAIVVGILALLLGIRDFMVRSFDQDAISTVADTFSLQIPDIMQDMFTPSPFMAFLSTFINVFLFWIVAAAILYFVGTTFFGGKATMGEMLRVTGFAQAPRYFSLLALGGIIPCFSQLIVLGAAIWTIATNFVGIRQGLDLSTWRTLFAILVSYFVAWLLSLVVSFVFGAIF